ncbi:type II toxin-antitoxin system RelE/ParE family toxin [Candidatus Parcubacteria bacterium]|nr:type II toxin-antitoxin system RelE/ParE family toxin [Candidatus Parcubacteria bacterium]
MADGTSKEVLRIVYASEFERLLARCKKKDQKLYRQIGRQIMKILREPNIGKPLRYSLKNRRRVHVGSFVLVYEFHAGELRFLDFAHHDKIYQA